MQTQTNNETTIDLVKLFHFVCTKWKQLVIFGLIGLLIGVGLDFVKPITTQQKFDAIDIEDKDFNMNLVKQYHDYNNLYKTELEYEKNSVLINMDPNNAYSGKLSFYFECDESSRDLVGESLARAIYKNNNINRVLEASGLNVTDGEIDELINIRYAKYENTNLLISDSEIDKKGMGLVSINFIAPTQISAEAMLTEMDLIQSEVYKQLQIEYEIKGNEVERSITNGYSALVTNAQTSAVENRQKYLDKIATLEKSMDDNEKLYYKVVYANALDAADDAEETNITSYLKYPVIGAIIGVLVVAGYYCLVYVLDGHVKSEDDLVCQFGLHVLALIDERAGAKNAIDKVIYDIDTKQSAKANSLEYAKTALKSLLDKLNAADTDKFMICAEETEPAEMANELASSDSRLVATGFIGADINAIELAKTCKGSIVMVKLWQTSRKDLSREIEVNKSLGKEIIGVIAIK